MVLPMEEFWKSVLAAATLYACDQSVGRNGILGIYRSSSYVALCACFRLPLWTFCKLSFAVVCISSVVHAKAIANDSQIGTMVRDCVFCRALDFLQRIELHETSIQHGSALF